MLNLIVSPYFTVNTKLVANMCRKCYSEEDEEESVVVTSVNMKFLRIYDPKQYLVFINNFHTIDLIKSDVTNMNEENCMRLNQSATLNSNRTTDKIKQRIVKKYFKFNFNRYYVNSSPSNRNTRKKPKQLQKQENRISNMASSPYIKEENMNEHLIERTMKPEQIETKIKNETTDEADKEQINKKEELLNNIFKYGKTDEIDQNSKWIPPISPHNLIEEEYYNDPWALLVVTIFLNRTSCLLALPHMEKFFEDFKGPYDVLKVEVGHLEPYFTKIGLIKTRANQVWRMSFDFVHKDWKNPGELYGVGKYAEDAYRMFHLGDFNVEPTDRYLKIYKAWYEMKQRNEKLGIPENNSQVYLEDYFIVPEDEDRTEELKGPN